MENGKSFNQQSLEYAWRQIHDILFHPGTGMVYDYVTSHDPNHRFDHLPSPEEIAAGFPNPCGWSTGMEDCALNGGILLDLMRFRGWENSVFAAKIAEGVIRCGTVHGQDGFIARGISPHDGKSCYSNSSRDQFTLAVYGMWRFLKGCAISGILRENGIRFLRSVADYCERTITPEHRYNLLRLDGHQAVVSSLWDCDPHEAMRLPMIYGIAWDMTGEPHYFDLMNRYAQAGLRHTLTLDPEADYWWDMPLLQMQLSLNFFCESGVLPALTAEIRRVMHTAALIALHRLPALLCEAETFGGDWGALYDNWRTLPMRMRSETLSRDGRSGLFGGKSYLNPVFRQEYARPNMILRGTGNYLAVIAHCPDTPFPASLHNRIERILRKIDFMRFAGAGTVPLVYGYSALSAYGKLDAMDNPAWKEDVSRMMVV